MRAYSQDLRDRVLRALERGDRPSAIAQRFEVSRMWVYPVQHRWLDEGLRSSLAMGGHRRSRIAHLQETIRGWIEVQPDLTLAQLSERLQDQGIEIKITALWHQLDKWGLSFKKTLHASEPQREDVQQARRSWKERQPSWNVEKLVFLDETAVTTHMTRLRGRSARGTRCLAHAPHGHWKTTPFIAGLRCDEVSAPLVIDGPLDGAMFLAWVHECLCPSLSAGEVVVADNLSSHKGLQEFRRHCRRWAHASSIYRLTRQTSIR